MGLAEPQCKAAPLLPAQASPPAPLLSALKLINPNHPAPDLPAHDYEDKDALMQSLASQVVEEAKRAKEEEDDESRRNMMTAERIARGTRKLEMKAAGYRR